MPTVLASRIGDLTDSIGSWKPSELGTPEFTYIDLSAVDQDAKVINGARTLKVSEAPSRARQLVKEGDILVATVRPNLNGVAFVPKALDGAIASTGFCVLRPKKNKIDGRYLLHWVKSPLFVADMVRKATGASYPAVSDRIVHDSEIPLPPLPEQRRIADILDRAEALRAKRREALALLDQLPQAIFLEMFGDVFSSANRWEKKPLVEVSEEINDCPHSTPEWTESGFRCLRTSNLGYGVWNWEDSRYVSEETYHDRSKRGYLQEGDIVLSREGTVGIAAIVPEGIPMCMGQRLVQVRPNARVLDSLFVLEFLLQALSPQRIKQLMVGSTSHHLNVKELRQLTVPVPPLALQKTFSTRLKRLNLLNDKSLAANETLTSLFASLQHRAFRGEL